MKPSTIKLFLITGDPKGLRTAQLSNWSGKSVAGPRSKLDELRKRDESKKPGVYMLVGKSNETDEDVIYIGETENIDGRLFQHLEKEFWNQAVYFVSKDENLTKSHTKYLENKLISEAKKSGRYKLDNTNSSGAKLPEEDRAEMDEFFENILRLAPIMGIEAFTSISGGKIKASQEQLFSTEIKEVRATGYVSESGFIVSAGSFAVKDLRPSCPEIVSRIRKDLIDKNILSEKGKHYEFLKNHEFNSPSLAAGVIHGGSANGRVAWKNSDGITLKEYEESTQKNREVNDAT